MDNRWQRVLNDIQGARFSCSGIIWLLPQPISCQYAWLATHRKTEKKRQLAGEWGWRGGAKSDEESLVIGLLLVLNNPKQRRICHWLNVPAENSKISPSNAKQGPATCPTRSKIKLTKYVYADNLVYQSWVCFKRKTWKKNPKRRASEKVENLPQPWSILLRSTHAFQQKSNPSLDQVPLKRRLKGRQSVRGWVLGGKQPQGNKRHGQVGGDGWRQRVFNDF